MGYITASGKKISKGTLCYHVGHLLMAEHEELFDELAERVLAEYQPNARGSAKSRRVKDVKLIMADPDLRNKLSAVVNELRFKVDNGLLTVDDPDCEEDPEGETDLFAVGTE